MRRLRSWADLPIEILRLFLDGLRFADHARFAAVCTSWFAAAADRPHFRALKFPWLLVSNHRSGELTWDLFSPLERRLHRLNLPKLEEKTYCAGASHGWLIMSQAKPDTTPGNFLLNPLTNQMIAIAQGHLFCRQYAKAILSSPPTSHNIDAGNCLVVATHGAFDDAMLFCRPGKKSWSKFPNMKRAKYITDFIFRDGLLHCVNIWREIMVFRFVPGCSKPKLLNLCIPTRIAPFENYHLRSYPYLVESAGELLMVIRYMMDDGETDDETENDGGRHFREDWSAPADFEVFKLDTRVFMCVPVKNLGDQVLVLGVGCSRSITVGIDSEFRRNSIYFTEIEPIPDYRSFKNRGVFCLKDNNIKMKSHPKCGGYGPFWLMLNA